MKKIVLMPTRNDAWILEKNLKGLDLWADRIIIADQNSTDDTVKICRAFPKVILINNPNKFHSTQVRQRLLEEARKIPGNNFIFSLDSDEFATADILTQDFWKKIESFEPGTSFEFQWVQLWRSVFEYRQDGSVWSDSWKPFAFIDDRVSDYKYDYLLNDHNPRVPAVPLQKRVRLEMPKVLHYQFVNWDRMLSKQRFYRVQDYLQRRSGFSSALRVNHVYYISKLEEDIGLAKTPAEWTSEYKKQGIDLDTITDKQPYWYDLLVLEWFRQYGARHFAALDIWDIDWEQLRQLAVTQGRADLNDFQIRDPRSIFLKLLHKNLNWVFGLLRPLKKLLKILYGK
jgi:glycosyltransferase involved in cell wall biosynthesis